MAESQAGILRGMALNYTERHSWDHLDAEACAKAADEILALRAALQQVTAERDEARAEVERLRAVLDFEKRAHRVVAAELARLRAEGEAKDRALKPFADAADAYGHSHDESQINERPTWAGKDYVEARILAKHLRAARAATAREGA